MATARISIRLQPRASRNQIVGWHGPALKVQVHAPPVDGAANEALIAFLARALRVAPRSLRIVHGHKNRDKLLEIDGLTNPECVQRLRQLARVDNEGAGD